MHTMRGMNINEILAILRTEHHLTQREIEQNTGISQSRICRWEAGQVAAGADDALRLLAYYKKVTKKGKKA